MTRDLLRRAAGEVEAAREAIPEPEARDRLEALSDQLRAQAERGTTPALGALDRVHVKLGEIQRQTGQATATEAIERAREDILAFLETLDDRGMKQHGESRNDDANGSI